MKGKYRISVYNNKVKYEFEIKRNITVIRGDSATGKTQLINMLRDFEEQGISSGITLKCEKECVVLEGKRWKENLAAIEESIVFIDEGQDFIKSVEFAECVKGSSNYFVLVTREKLYSLPYSINEIYGIREHGKYPAVTQVYNEMYQLYTEAETGICESPELVVTEDKCSGYQFFEKVMEDQAGGCVSADGKSNILSFLLTEKKDKVETLIVVDGAAFGPEMEEMMEFIHFHKNVHLYAPESFEWMILKSGIVATVQNELENTYEYADSSMYMSWEQYYTDLLRKLTQDTVYQYRKEKLKEYYLTTRSRKRILDVMGKVKFPGHPA